MLSIRVTPADVFFDVVGMQGALEEYTPVLYPRDPTA